MRVLFWGTPDFAVPPLRALLGEGFEVVGVVTQPDRPHGRSRSRVVASPVKEVAVAEGIPVLQPEKPRGEEFVEAVRALAPDISVVVAYGHILPRAVIDLPPMGTLNIHASLLPALRGAAPIQAAVRDGLAETGVTIMRMVPALDAGPIVLQQATPLLSDETYGELQQRLSELGALALVEALALLSLGAAEERPQDDALATYAPKVERDTARVRWTDDADAVARAIRAYDPKPGAFATLRGADVKLYGARALDPADPQSEHGTPGEVLSIGPTCAVVRCGRGAVCVAEWQPAGKRRLPAADLARGRGLEVGELLG